MFDMKFNYKYLTILAVFFAFSCGSSKKTSNKENSRVTTENRNSNPAPSGTVPGSIEEYIAMYAPVAKEEMELYNIPASITLAQGILESGSGKSELTRRANNHFGIKCHEWQGQKVYHDDDRAQECFRKYDNAKYSFRDHSLFLAERKRYAGLFDLSIEDYKGWAKGLRAAGYATDRAYPAKLISIIERYQLYRYDAEVLGGGRINYQVAQNSSGNSGTEYEVKKGDTLYSIGRRFDVSVEQIMKYNNLRSTTISVGQRLNVQSNQ